MEVAMQTQKVIEPTKSTPGPIFVEAEKLVEQMHTLTQTVAKRAYEFFEERGSQIGHELEDWFRAEEELLRPVPFELKEDEKQFTVRAETPGFRPDEIKISAEPQRILIKGKTEANKEEKSENTVFSERRSNQFYRALALAAEIDPAQATASLKDGILEILLPKIPVKQAVDVNVKEG
jgi:HSP20 family protein